MVRKRESELNEDITTAQFWEYESRIGRRWNVDPVTKEFESPYATFSKYPIYYTDTKGADSEPQGGDKPQYKKPGFLKRLWRGLGGAHHINRAETYAAEVQKCASDVQLVNVDKDTKVVIAKFQYDANNI